MFLFVPYVSSVLCRFMFYLCGKYDAVATATKGQPSDGGADGDLMVETRPPKD
jgi:hypothetical protein